MSWHKKAEAPSELMFKFGFFYLPLTAVVVMAFVIFPRNLMASSLQAVPFDEATEARQLHSRLWATDENTGRTSPFIYVSDLGDINVTYTRKKMAYGVTLDGQQKIYEKQFYDIAKPIAPFRYLGYTETRPVNVDGDTKQLTLEIFQPYKYEIKP